MYRENGGETSDQHGVCEALMAGEIAMGAFAVKPNEEVPAEVKHAVFYMAWLLVNVAADLCERHTLWEGEREGQPYKIVLQPYLDSRRRLVDMLVHSGVYAPDFYGRAMPFAPEDMLVTDGEEPPPFQRLTGWRARGAVLGLLSLLVIDAERLLEGTEWYWYDPNNPDDAAAFETPEAAAHWEDRWHPREMVSRAEELCVQAERLMQTAEVMVA